MDTPEHLNAAGLPLDFESEYSRVEQFDDHSCLFAVIGMVAGCTAQEVRSVAIANGHIPEHGPYAIVDDGSLAAFLVAHYGWVASNWKECKATYQLPDLAILLVEVRERFGGRHILYGRQRNGGGRPRVEFVIDPGFWVPVDQQIRAIRDYELSWFISLHPMAESDH